MKKPLEPRYSTAAFHGLSVANSVAMIHPLSGKRLVASIQTRNQAPRLEPARAQLLRCTRPRSGRLTGGGPLAESGRLNRSRPCGSEAGRWTPPCSQSLSWSDGMNPRCSLAGGAR